jgi:hypothetical protein
MNLSPQDSPVRIPQWRIKVLSNDGINLANEEILVGDEPFEIASRALALGRRASYVPDLPNRRVYVSVERWSYKRREWIRVWDRKMKVRDNWHHANLAPFRMPEVVFPQQIFQVGGVPWQS